MRSRLLCSLSTDDSPIIEIAAALESSVATSSIILILPEFSLFIILESFHRMITRLRFTSAQMRWNVTSACTLSVTLVQVQRSKLGKATKCD